MVRVVKRLLTAGALLALALAAAASGGHARAAGTVSSSGLVEGGTVRITVTIHTPVQVGHVLRGRFTVRNVSNEPQEIHLDHNYLWVVIRSPDGATFDTRIAYGDRRGPGPVPPVKLRPGQAVTRGILVPLVRWSGPLRITPGWNEKALPALHVAVSTPGPTPSAATAMADVVASTGRLLDGCTPTKPGVAVTGTIVAPKHSAPPLHVACSIRLHREPGFVRAQVLVVSPAGMHGVHVSSTYERLSFPSGGKNATAAAWLFVVTQRGATSVDSDTVDSTKAAKRSFPEWQWTRSGFQGTADDETCLDAAESIGPGDPTGPVIAFVSKCG